MDILRMSYYDALVKVLRNLTSTLGQGLFVSTTSSLKLNAYCDANWANCPDTRRSTTRFFIFLEKSLVAWKSKKQNTISRSSVESEYRTMAAIICELTWLRYLLQDLYITISYLATLYCDNLAALHIDANLVFYERTKHIELDCHHVHDKISTGQLATTHVSSSDQLGDLFTKPMHPLTLTRLLSKMGVLNIYSPSCGGY